MCRSMPKVKHRPLESRYEEEQTGLRMVPVQASKESIGGGAAERSEETTPSSETLKSDSFR